MRPGYVYPAPKELARLQQAAVRVTMKYEQRVNGPIYKKLVRRLRKRLESLKIEGSKSRVAVEWLGCTVPELKRHLEARFRPGMTWENHSFEGWHIDHIRPLAVFDLTDPAQQRECFHYKNLQPLWQQENFSKGTKAHSLAVVLEKAVSSPQHP